MNIKTIFLYDKIDEIIYIEQSIDLRNDTTKIYKFNKVFYDFK